MPNVTFQWNNEREVSKAELISLLHRFGDLLPNPLAKRVNIPDYAAKLLSHADIGLAFSEQDAVGFFALYANNIETQIAHFIMLSILPTHQGCDIGKEMFSRGFALCQQRGMHSCTLNVQATNTPAQNLYLSYGFKFESTEGSSWPMRCVIPTVVQ